MSGQTRTKVAGTTPSSGKKNPPTGKLDSARSGAQTGSMHLFSPLRILGLIVALSISGSARAASRTLKISAAAGDFDRENVVATVVLPASFQSESIALKRGGNFIPAQLSGDGRLTFLIGKLARNSSVTFELSTADPPRAGSRGGVQVTRKDKVLQFSLDGAAGASRQVMAYQARPGEFPRPDIKALFERGGYLHPIMTPSGKAVTDDFPPNHVHHHGVWWAWTSTEFDGRKPDFWNMGDGKGRVEFETVEHIWSGVVHGGFRATHRFVDLTSALPVTALNETWQVTAYAAQPSSRHWIFDLVSEQQCATDKELKLPEYRYGGVGVRGNWAWNGEGKALFLTSDGETDRVKGNTTRGRWCDMGGLLDGERAGIAVLCHPNNFRAPQPMRLHPSEPFFNFAPQQAGDMAIKPGAKYVSKYRFVVHDGAPDRAELDRLWNDFAHPPVVTVSE